MERDLKRGILDTLLLKLLDGHDRYGYELVTLLEERGRGMLTIKEGTLYPILYRLEANGCIESRWEARARGNPRKYYHITDVGLRVLERQLLEWHSFNQAVQDVLSHNGS